MMSQEASKVIIRQWNIIQILLEGNYVGTADIENKLLNKTIEVSQRTIQRDLKLLEKIFPLECRRDCVPYSWRWKKVSKKMNHLNVSQALILRLVDEQLRDILPDDMLDELQPLFEKAKYTILGVDIASQEKGILDRLIDNRKYRGGNLGISNNSIFNELSMEIGKSVNDLYRDVFNIDEKEVKSNLNKLEIFLESNELPLLAQALKSF